MEKRAILVVDIGGSKYMPGFVDETGEILYQERREWEGVHREAVVEQLITAIRDVCKKCPELAGQATAGGLTIPGFADPEQGIWVESDFLKIRDLPICKILEEEFGLPFYADNDGKACALAEKYFGSAREAENFLYMTVSTGIGGAFYLKGSLYDGAECHAGEVGQPVVEEYGRPSDTGSVRGIVEMYASGRGLEWNYRELETARSRVNQTKTDCANSICTEQNQAENKLGGKEIALLASQQDPAACEAVEREGRYLGRVIANTYCMIPLQKVVIGGGISLMFSSFEAALNKELHRIHPNSTLSVVPTELGYCGAFLGAAAVALRGLKGENKRNWSGIGSENRLSLEIGETLRITLVQDGIDLSENEEKEERAEHVEKAGRFCTAAHITEEGCSIDELLRKHQSGTASTEEVAHAVGKAAAAGAVMLDPGRLEIIGELTDKEEFRREFYETLCRETFYRGVFPFELVYSQERSCL